MISPLTGVVLTQIIIIDNININMNIVINIIATFRKSNHNNPNIIPESSRNNQKTHPDWISNAYPKSMPTSSKYNIKFILKSSQNNFEVIPKSSPKHSKNN